MKRRARSIFICGRKKGKRAEKVGGDARFKGQVLLINLNDSRSEGAIIFHFKSAITAKGGLAQPAVDRK